MARAMFQASTVATFLLLCLNSVVSLKVGVDGPAKSNVIRVILRPSGIAEVPVETPAGARVPSPAKLPETSSAPSKEIEAANPYAHEYWYDPRIHTFSNIGIGGRIHALMAPFFTYLIDKLSYSGLDVRKKIHETIEPEASVLDLCCGVGFSAAPGATCVDTSNEMLDVARWRRPDCTIDFGNAETYGEDDSFDVVTMMFATHEMPMAGRRRVLRNALRVARKEVIIVDIDPDFEETLKAKPMAGKSFLSGEPYVLEYLENMDGDVRASAQPSRSGRSQRKWQVERERVLPKHVVAWRFKRVA